MKLITYRPRESCVFRAADTYTMRMSSVQQRNGVKRHLSLSCDYFANSMNTDGSVHGP